jgi:hypothetical protein
LTEAIIAFRLYSGDPLSVDAVRSRSRGLRPALRSPLARAHETLSHSSPVEVEQDLRKARPAAATSRTRIGRDPI